MKHLKKFESLSIRERVLRSKEIEYNIKCLLLSLTDDGCDIVINSAFASKLSREVTIYINNLVKFKNSIIDDLLSLIDYMNTIDYKYSSLFISMFASCDSDIQCKIVDGRFQRYPLYRNKFIEPNSANGIKIIFKEIK